MVFFVFFYLKKIFRGKKRIYDSFSLNIYLFIRYIYVRARLRACARKVLLITSVLAIT